MVDLERVLHAEYNLAQDLRSYVEREQQRIDVLKRYAFTASFLNCYQTVYQGCLLIIPILLCVLISSGC